MNGKGNPARVVIIGGGFGGLFAARALRRARVSITLIDRDGTHLFQPLLYQCATGILSEGQITAALRHLFRKQHNLDCLTAEAIDVDAGGQRVICGLPLGKQIDVPYDHLIVAAGMRQSYFGHDEFATWAPGMKNIADALTIRRRVYGAFDMAETAGDPAGQRHWLTFALVGAGPTGVELAGQIRELATKTLRAEYRKFQPEDARVLLFDGGSAPLATFGDTLSRKATSTLQSLGVELHMRSIVTKVDGDGLIAHDHDGHQTAFDAGTVLWTAGVEAPPIAEALAKATGAEHDRAGRIAVQDDLTIKGHPEISVVGDMMTLRKLPGVAEVAMQGGLYAGHRIKRLQNGNASSRPFTYHDLGSAAYVYRGRAVVSAGPLKLSGFPGWMIWLFIHIAFLTGYRNRVGAILTWLVAFTRDTRRERAYTTRATGHLQDVYQPAGPAQGPGTATGDTAAATPQPKWRLLAELARPFIVWRRTAPAGSGPGHLAWLADHWERSDGMTHDDAPLPGRHPAYGDLPAQVHGLAVRFGLRGLQHRHDSRAVLGSYVLVNSAVSIAILAGIAALTKQPFVFPSLGPTAFLLFYAALGAQAAPRNVFCGHLIGVLAGYLALAIFGLTTAKPSLTDVAAPRIGAVTVCLCLTLSLMVWLNVPHAPAGATTLIVGLGLMRTPFQLTVVMIAVVLMIAQGLIINRLARLPYPLWAPRETAR